jgi:hypothetical protein
MELSTSGKIVSAVRSLMDAPRATSPRFSFLCVWRLLSSFPVPRVLILSRVSRSVWSHLSRRPRDFLLPHTTAAASVSLRTWWLSMSLAPPRSLRTWAHRVPFSVGLHPCPPSPLLVLFPFSLSLSLSLLPLLASYTYACGIRRRAPTPTLHFARYTSDDASMKEKQLAWGPSGEQSLRWASGSVSRGRP